MTTLTVLITPPRDWRAFIAFLVSSVAVHVLALGLVVTTTSFGGRIAEDAGAGAETRPELHTVLVFEACSVTATCAIDRAPVASAAAKTDEVDRPILLHALLTQTTVGATAAVHEDTRGEGSSDPIGLSASEILKPQLSDRRLWAIAPDSAATPRIALRPSASESADRKPSNLSKDPTAFSSMAKSDDKGLRWGLAPGSIYVAGRRMPVCSGRFDASDCGFGTAPGRRDEYRSWLRATTEIQSQILQGVIRERAGAVRARRDAERNK